MYGGVQELHFLTLIAVEDLYVTSMYINHLDKEQEVSFDLPMFLIFR